MVITLLDTSTLGAGLNLKVLEKFGEVECYEKTQYEETADRLKNTEILIINKVKLNADTLKKAKKLKLICVFATGYDNIDLAYCREKGIAVCNVKGYSTDSVAQLTIAMALQIINRIPEFTRYVTDGSYTKSGVQNYLKPQFNEISGKVWGIIGYGNIGKKVACVASALGCKVIVNKRTPTLDYENATVQEICKTADIISIHTPLTEQTKGLIGENELIAMKKTAILINVSRGAVTDEKAVVEAIKCGEIGGFGADVYSVEPFDENHPFNDIMNMDNVCLTPHMGWGALEARRRCLDEIVKNIEAYNLGETRNRVDLL